MAKDVKNYEYEKEAPEPKKEAKAEIVQPFTQSEPYPTGSPPDLSNQFAELHPQEARAIAEAEASEKAEAKSKKEK